MNVTIIQGDAAQQADALVNAAGTSHKMGSGVASVLRRGAGGDSNAEVMANGPVDPGEVVATDAYDIDAEYVIYAAAMPHDGDRQATTESIRNATRNTLEKADELGCESVVFPVLGTGVAGFDFERGAELICSVIADYESSTLTDVRVIAYSDSEYESLQSVADTIQD
ncbi:macro domain-containing protein [Halonotius pteroides]|uniref:Appr-1-p processing protein n=1 Tax=Halonotius pteroides TaxID=268735 RepID=A0A3A6QDN8_9EURY|nr:macro domain-containing protein [Halonotius pteroides]RJX51135.1 Appr-1-p processing protein [Halonotius pteroides]